MEQKLIDICFSIAFQIQSNRKYFDTISPEETMEWVAKQLEGCGFKTVPMGASWGILERNIKWRR